MKKYRLLAVLLALAMLAALLTGCSTAKQPAAEEPAASEEAPAPSEAPAAESVQPSAEAPVAEEPVPVEEPAKTISYPIPGDLTFTMSNVYNPNASKVYGNGDYTAAVTYKTLAERTGVNIEFTMLAESTYSTSLDLMIAGGEYPDMFGRSIGTAGNDLMKAISDEIILDLDPLLEDNAPDLYALIQSDPDYADGLYNSDGTLGKVAGWNINMTTSGLFVRQDWLDTVGIAAPSTLDELTEVLRAFKTEYNCANAILVDADLGSGLGNLFNSSAMGFKMLNFQQTAPNSGVLECALSSEGFIDYLLYLNQLYSEGIINDDFLNISKDIGNLEEQYVTGISGVWNDDAKYTYANQTAARNDDPNWTATAFNLDRTENHLVQTVTGGSVGMTVLYVSAACEHPEEVVQFINYGFTQEGMDLIALGEEGVTYNTDANGKVQFTDEIINNPDGYTSEQAKYLYLTEAWFPTVQQMKVFEMSYSEDVMKAYDVWSEEQGGDDSMLVPREVKLSSDAQRRVFEISSDVITLFNENAAKVIFGEITADDYRAVVETANDAGLTEITEIYQSAYDDYMAG